MEKATRDIFATPLRLPEKVCVLAPGPNGIDQYQRITIFTIAVNYGVAVPLLRAWDTDPKLVDPVMDYVRQAEMWVVADWWGVKTDWFPNADKLYRGVRCFSENLISKRPTDAKPADWSFRFTDGKKCVKPLGSGTYSPHKSELRPDGTSSCIAIEIAARFGAKEIAVCGVDFRGEEYFDGRKGCFQMYDRTGPWAFLPFANSLIAWVKSQGIDIYSLSETELDLEVR